MHALGIRFWRFTEGDFVSNDVKVPAVQVQFKCVPRDQLERTAGVATSLAHALIELAPRPLINALKRTPSFLFPSLYLAYP